jgi:hypothetical protein
MNRDATQPLHPLDVAALVNALTAEFPTHSIEAEHTADSGVRWIARNRTDEIHPRVVVTPYIAELREAINGG